MSKILVTGPSRSGKSEFAESLAKQASRSIMYIATSAVDPRDQEWQQRLDQHRQRRPAHWGTWEIPVALPAAIAKLDSTQWGLVDSLGTWVANSLETDAKSWDLTVSQLLSAIRQSTAAGLIFVAEETGWGLVPAYASGRLFRDRLGSLTRQMGVIADALYLVVAGYALDLKILGQSVERAL
ncbi:MAG: bifunctional adenosylcobinamide kinase/adenosylcobinamide-phosphate guanylyltransferase [Cyanobacteria bacterium P01_H01_bin.15]